MVSVAGAYPENNFGERAWYCRKRLLWSAETFLKIVVFTNWEILGRA